MTWKERALLLVLPVLVVAWLLAATPRPATGLPSVARATPEGWQTVAADPAQPVRLRWLMAGRSLDEPYRLRYLAEHHHVAVDAVYLSPEAMMTAQPLMLSAGDIPDLFNPGGNVNLRKYAHHGYLMELPYALLRTHAPNIVKLANTYTPNLWPSLALDGHNYGVPAVWYAGLQPRVGVWRLDWLRRVGLTHVPTTLAEYEEALRRFRDRDPDGDGRQNTYGMTGDLMSQYVTFTEIFGAFGVMPYNWLARDGTVVWGGVQPEAKEALTLLHRWYADGLIHPDFLTDRWYREVPAKFKNGKIGYVNYLASYEAFNPDNPGALINEMRALQPGCELAPGVPPLGPRGERGHRVWGAAGSNMVVFGRQMAERPADVIRALHVLDALVADEATYVAWHLGRQGTHWEWRDPAVGEGSGVRFLPPFDTPQARERAGLVQDAVWLDGTWPHLFRKYLPRAMVAWEDEHRRVEWGRPDLFYWSTSVPRAEEFLSDLERLQQTVYADIIRGVRPLAAFDEFVRQWHAQGGDRLLAGAQATYAQAQAIRAQLEAAP